MDDLSHASMLAATPTTAPTPARMVELVGMLAEAKGRQDVRAALAVCHAEMTLESPAFDSIARGHVENERALTAFFTLFPDYGVELHGHAANESTLSAWGLVRMTMNGGVLGLSTNGTQTTVPVAMQFTFKDDKILSERFLIDLATVCAQSGVSTDQVRSMFLTPN